MIPKLLVNQILKIYKSQNSARIGLQLGKKKYKSKPPSFTQTKYRYNAVRTYL